MTPGHLAQVGGQDWGGLGTQSSLLGKGTVQPGGWGRPSPHLKYWMPTISHQARARSTARPSGSVHW